MAIDETDRGFSIGRTFSRAFSVIGNNPLVSFGVTLVLSAIPGVFANYGFSQLRLDWQDRDMVLGIVGIGVMAFAVAILLRALVQGCLVRATIADSEGRKASLGECLEVAFSRALPLIGVSILFVIGFVVGFVLLIVPGIMFAIACAVVAPVVVEENVGVIEAFGRASVLTRGARWKIFGLALLAMVLIWVIEAIVGLFSVTLFGVSPDPLALPLILFNVVVGTLVATFSSTLQTALYVELRNWKDGAPASRLGEIFE